MQALPAVPAVVVVFFRLVEVAAPLMKDLLAAMAQMLPTQLKTQAVVAEQAALAAMAQLLPALLLARAALV
jgi:hypothetical protein